MPVVKYRAQTTLHLNDEILHVFALDVATGISNNHYFKIFVQTNIKLTVSGFHCRF